MKTPLYASSGLPIDKENALDAPKDDYIA